MSDNAANPSFAVSVVMERIAIESRWQSHKWQPAAILPDDGMRVLPEVMSTSSGATEVLFPGFALQVFRDEAEGYYLNVSSPDPQVFVMWRIAENSVEDAPADAPDRAVPHSVTLSYNEAARWMDAQEKVDPVAMPPQILDALSEWVKLNYSPPDKKQRIRPTSFESKEGRYKSGMSS
ncbi:MAG: DUF3305 domain-containing protein [Aeromicrobium sp.]|nr:DUF3305 domain-containing protein [Burkholderiales bacterium]